MKGWVGLVGWPIADGLPTLVVTHQLQVERRTGKVRRSETDVLPLCHATNLGIFTTWGINNNNNSNNNDKTSGTTAPVGGCIRRAGSHRHSVDANHGRRPRDVMSAASATVPPSPSTPLCRQTGPFNPASVPMSMSKLQAKWWLFHAPHSHWTFFTDGLGSKFATKFSFV